MNFYYSMRLKDSLFFFFFCFCTGLIFAQPVACFKADKDSGCKPVTVKFTDCSTGSPTIWTWSLGNGNSSSFQNGVGAVYYSPGIYTVTLTVSNSLGSNTTSSTITVFDNPRAGF